MASFSERVASRASEVRPVQLLLSLLAAPFYAVGFVAGILLAVLTWAIAAVQLGVSDVRRRETHDAG